MPTYKVTETKDVVTGIEDWGDAIGVAVSSAKPGKGIFLVETQYSDDEIKKYISDLDALAKALEPIYEFHFPEPHGQDVHDLLVFIWGMIKVEKRRWEFRMSK